MKLHLPWPLSLALGTGLYGLAAAVINLSNVNTTGLSATCISVLKQSVACDPLLLQVGFGRYEDDATLSTVCTSSCAAAMTTYIRRIDRACGTARYNGGDGYFYLAAFGAESTYERYQTTCLQNPAGQYCNAVIRDILGVDPSNQIPSSSIASQYTSLLCNDCFISSLATVLAMPISSAGAYSTALSEVTSSCKTTIAVNTPPTSTTWSLPSVISYLLSSMLNKTGVTDFISEPQHLRQPAVREPSTISKLATRAKAFRCKAASARPPFSRPTAYQRTAPTSPQAGVSAFLRACNARRTRYRTTIPAARSRRSAG